MPIDFPNSPAPNEVFTVDGRSWKWNEVYWESVATTGPTGPTGPARGLFVSDTAPSAPIQGDSWYNSATGQQFVYYDDYWVESSASVAGPTGPSALAISSPGDLLVGNSSGVAARLPIGSEGSYLGVTAGQVTWQTSPQDNEKFWLIPPNQFSTINQDLPTGFTYLFTRIVGTGSLVIRLLNSSDVVFSTFSLSGGGTSVTPVESVAKILVESNLSTNAWLRITIPTSAPIAVAKKAYLITSTQSVTTDRTLTAYLIGGGGAGGGVSASFDSNAGGGGGSGFYETGTLAAGTYTATVGTGGLGVSAGNGGDGGTTSIGALSAAGGSGGRVPTANNIGGAGGNGGSGGSGGAAGSSTGPNAALAGFQGGNGQTGTVYTTGTGGAGGTGSGVPFPTAITLLNYLVSPATGAATNGSGGGVYGGGSGGAMASSSANGTAAVASNYGAGGGGARGDTGANTAAAGGTGASGVIVLLET